jgi:two-component system sensor histidine kinase RegB
MPEIIHSLGGFLENAVGFADTTVHFEARWTADQVVVEIRDDGPGFAPGMLQRLGEPYVTEREGGQAGGLGLGFFIAKTLLERTGARVDPKNRPQPQHGAMVRVSWPREAIEAPPA